MIKNLLVTLVFLVQSIASAAPITELKDFSLKNISSSAVEMVYKGEKFVLEKVGDNKFNLNGQGLSIIQTDTLDQVQMKFQNAYKASKKKSASLESLLINEADAAVPFIALLGAMGVTWAFTHATMKNKCEKASGSYGSEPAPSVVN